MTVNMHEAKTNLSKLIGFLEQGEEVVIAKAGNPVAKLVAYVSPKQRRVPNLLKDHVIYYEDFDRADDEIARLFEGEE